MTSRLPEDPLEGEEETVVQRGPPPPGPPPPAGPPPEEAERHLWPWLLVLLLLVAGGVIAAVLLTRGGGHHKRTVPNVVGIAQAAAVSKVQNAGLKTSIANRFSSQPPGTVIVQKPASGARIERGSVVTLTVSRGQKAVAVPNLISLSQSDAVAQLAKAGLNPDVTLVPSSQPQGRVVAQNPAAGAEVDPGTSVRVNVSKGRTTTTVRTSTTVTTTRTTTQPTTTVTSTVTTTTTPTSP